MFTITFYSYKGGVGRTMGLVNVAADLAQRGKRVLIIDFDLEAPGIASFTQFSVSDSRVGIVDYVSEYIETSVAPDVSEYIVETSLEGPTATMPIWILPAGRRDDGYGNKLSSIDWQDLYDNRSGYLLFEDMKQQLQADSRRFDYVLIDSRTGHTDVGGICTRQLADAVTFMFFPNSQNISGLKTIVSQIRSDRHLGSEQAKLLFCPSNVPDLDDEDGILKAMLENASRELGYEEPCATIRHYNSMSLVDQKIFVVDRPRTKLAGEYRGLSEALVQLNLEDRDGAMLALRQTRRELRARSKQGSRARGSRPVPLNEITAELDRISSIHREDGEINWTLASLYHELGDFPNEMEALNGAISGGVNVQKAHLSRAFILLNQSRHREALEDLLAVVDSKDTAPIELRSAIEALKTNNVDWVEIIQRSPILEKLLPEDVGLISNALMSDVRALPTALALLLKGYQEGKDGEGVIDALHAELVLTLIAVGRFAQAIETISDRNANIMENDSIHDVFNYAMAQWGLDGNPSTKLFDRVLELSTLESSPDEPNFAQCLALAYAVTGRLEEALAFLQRAKKSASRGTIFSCWRYLTVGRSEMAVDLEQMSQAFRSGLIAPPVFEREPLSTIRIH